MNTIAYILIATGLSVQSGQSTRYGLDDIVAAQQRRYDLIETIALHCQQEVEAVISWDELFRESHMLPPLPVRGFVVTHRDGRFYQRESDQYSVLYDPLIRELGVEETNPSGLFALPFPVVREAAEAKMREQTVEPTIIKLFDGSTYWQHRPVTFLVTDGVQDVVYSIVTPENMAKRLRPTILDRILLSFAIPGLPNEAEKRGKYRLPDLFQLEEFGIIPQTESVDGADCVVVEALRSERLYFDPQLQFTLRKREWFRDGRIVFEVICREFERIESDLWFPRTVITVQYGSKSRMKGKYFGKPLYKTHYNNHDVSINEPEHLSWFSVDVPPGAWVIDQNLRPTDRHGTPVEVPEEPNVIPSVSYVMPADQADLDKVVAEAQQAQGEGLLATQPPDRDVTGWRRILIWFTVGFAGMLMLLIAYRATRGHGHSKS